MRAFLGLLFLLVAAPVQAAGLWDAAALGFGGQGSWSDQGSTPALNEFEAVGKGALSITPHVSVVGSVAYGVNQPYIRSSIGARITATDVTDDTFSVGVGASRWFVNDPADALDEWAVEAAVGWKPLTRWPVLVTGLAAIGVDSGRRTFLAGLILPIKLAGGSQ